MRKARPPQMETVILRFYEDEVLIATESYPSWEDALPHYELWINSGEGPRRKGYRSGNRMCEVQRVAQERNLRS